MRSILKYSHSAKQTLLYWAIEVMTGVLIVLWIYTGISKLIEYYDFRYQLSQSIYFSKYAGLMTFGIPILELSVAMLLIRRKHRLKGLIASFILMLLFTGYVYFILNYTKTLPCSCGGVLSSLSWDQHLYLNISLTIVSAIGIISYIFDKRLRKRLTE